MRDVIQRVAMYYKIWKKSNRVSDEKVSEVKKKKEKERGKKQAYLKTLANDDENCMELDFLLIFFWKAAGTFAMMCEHFKTYMSVLTC